MKKTALKTNRNRVAQYKSSRRKRSGGNVDREAQEIERSLQEAARHELSIHKRLGNPVATWRNRKVVVIPPEDISVSSER
jgi:hypothetical protein